MAFSPETFAILNGKIKTLQSEVDDLSSATKWLGVTTTPLRDGATTSSILIDNQYVTVEQGNIAAYNNIEFIYNGSIWQEFGSGEARNGIYYGTGSLISGSIRVTIPGFTNDSDYHDKLHIRVLMRQDRTGDSYLTMGINSLGVFPVYGGVITSGGMVDQMLPVPDKAWSAGEVVDFVLDYSLDIDGWVLVDGDRAPRSLGNNFGVCSTATGTAAKEVTIPGITKLTDGLSIRVLFENSSSITQPTLNVNNLGEKPIYRYTTVRVPNYFWRNWEVQDLVYISSSDCWFIVDSGTASTIYYGVTKLIDSVSSTSNDLAASANAVKTAYDAATTNLAPVEASSTASANYAAGDYLVLNGVLYKVTTAIAFGETITPGTNVTAATVTDITDDQDTRISALESALVGLSSQLSQI